MAKNIDPELKKIGSYLNLEDPAIFLIPEYQRAYSWKIKHCDKLWQDIENYIDSGGNDPYFFGTIIINCQEDDTKLSLIDGQQRTTTFILLCKALLLQIIQGIEETDNDDDSKRLNFSLEKKRDRLFQILYKATDDDLFALVDDFEKADTQQILKNNSINELYKGELETILKSPDFETAEENVVKIKYMKKDNKYTNFFRNFKFFYEKLKELSPSQTNIFAEYVLDKSEIIEIRSWNVEQAITMFNSLNSDGMPLLDADIISAKLYSRSGEDREGFNQKWSELKQIILELEESKVADIDSVLKQYMYIKRAQDLEYVSEKGSINVTTPGLRRYYTEENKELIENPLKLTAQLLKVAKTWGVIQDYSFIELCSKFNENFNIYLIAYLSRFEVDEITEKLVIEFAEELLKLFVILELVDIGYSSSKFKTFLFGLNTRLVDRNVPLDKIKDEIKDHIHKEWSREDMEIASMSYTKNPLVYLNEYLVCKERNQKFYLPFKYEIEHIMPRSGKNITQIREDAGVTDVDEFAEVVNKLGNKILLEENINRSIGNAWFRSKIQNSVIEKKGYKDSSFALSKQILSDFEGQENLLWTIQDIDDRTAIIARRISDFIFGPLKEE